MRKKQAAASQQPSDSFWKRRTNQNSNQTTGLTQHTNTSTRSLTSETIKRTSVPPCSLALCLSSLPCHQTLKSQMYSIIYLTLRHFTLSFSVSSCSSLASSSSWFVLFRFHDHVELVFWALQLFVLVPISGNVGMMYGTHFRNKKPNEGTKHTHTHRHQIIN